MWSSSEIPVTVLTGYLGSGKTTVLNRILNTASDLRIAVILEGSCCQDTLN